MSSLLLFAQAKSAAGDAEIPWPLITAVAVGVVLFGLIMLLVKRYKRCPSNRVLVIFGKTSGGNAAKCVHGGAAFVFPLIQDYAYLSLEPIQIEVPLKGALSIENIRVNVPSVFTVAIGTDAETMQNAAIRLLGLNTEEIKQQAGDIIFGQLRQVIASMRIEDINRDRDKFLESVQKSLEPELKKIGLVLINVNITDITDESGLHRGDRPQGRGEAIQTGQGGRGRAGEDRDRSAWPRPSANEPSRWPTRPSCARSAPARRPREQAIRVAQLDKERQVGEQTALLEQDASDQGSAAAAGDPHRRAGPRPEGRRAEGGVRARTAGRRGRSRQARSAGRRQRQGDGRRSDRPGEGCPAQAETRGEEGRGVSAFRNARSARPRPRCWKPRTGRWPRRPWPRPRRSRPRSGRSSKRRPRPRRRRPSSRPKPTPSKVKLEAEAQAAAIYAKLEAEARGQYEILAKKGDGLREDHRGVRLVPGRVPAADARTPGSRWPRRRPRRSRTSSSTRSWSGKAAATATAHRTRPHSCKDWPADAADAASDEGRGRRGDARVPGSAHRRHPGRREDNRGRRAESKWAPGREHAAGGHTGSGGRAPGSGNRAASSREERSQVWQSWEGIVRGCQPLPCGRGSPWHGEPRPQGSGRSVTECTRTREC